jgi:nitronate monooxygenase
MRSTADIWLQMGGQAGADMAIAVTIAGGLGFIGAGLDLGAVANNLSKVEQTLERHNGLLPIGLGLLPFVSKLDDVLPVLERYKPSIIWLFAAKELEDYATWAKAIRKAVPQLQVWVQVGSVSAALTVAQQCKPEAMCVQGIDAGGHGFEKGAGIISLLPEVSDKLAESGFSDIHLVAAGGIADGRAAAAAFVLGAEGAVLGTRFLASPEAQINPEYRRAVIHAHDGGQATTRDKLFDNLHGPNIWPGPYDGRSLVNESFMDYSNGVSIEEVRAKHKEASKAENGGYGINGQGRTAMWAGTGVGLVKKEQPAADIVEEVREQVLKALANAKSRL